MNAYIITLVSILYLVKAFCLSQGITNIFINSITYGLSIYVSFLFIYHSTKGTISIGNRIFNYVFYIFIIYSLILCIAYDFTHGFFNRTIVSILFNYVLGFTSIILLYRYAVIKPKCLKFLYLFSSIITISFFTFCLINSPIHSVFIKFSFSNDLISYQTLSGFTFRIYVCNIFMYLLLSRYNQSCKYCLLSFVIISLLCIQFSVFAGSKKEPFLFLLNFILVLIFTKNYRTIILSSIVFFTPILALLFKYDFNENLLLFNHLESSIFNRLKFITDNATLLLDNSLPFGIPNLDETLGLDYLHSSLLSVLRVNGIFGLTLFIIMLFLTLFRIRKNHVFLFIFILTFSLSIIATPYNWFVLWFCFGACNAYPINNEKFFILQKYSLSYS